MSNSTTKYCNVTFWILSAYPRGTERAERRSRRPLHDCVGFQTGSVSSRRDWRSINNIWILGEIFLKENVAPCKYSVSSGKRKPRKEKLQPAHSGGIGLRPGNQNENEFSIGVAGTNYQEDSLYIFFKGKREEGAVLFIKMTANKRQEWDIPFLATGCSMIMLLGEADHCHIWHINPMTFSITMATI